MGTKPKQKYLPASDADADEIFEYPFTVDVKTINFIKEHGRIMFIIRGPPGTGKNSLASMLENAYPNSRMCSADQYFTDTFSQSKRDKESLKKSHDFCHQKVKTACVQNVHPIIVKNTHMKKFELQTYLDFAAKYSYTVIMAITLHKFQVSPDILAKSNTKGLSSDYFKLRLKQWEEVIPMSTGWFMGPDDSSYLLSELQTALDSLLGDGKFCRILNTFEKAELLEYYRPRKLLYCVAACSENNQGRFRSYYLSDKVKEHYGQCFTIIIQAYLVTPSYVSAIVDLDKATMNVLSLKSKSKTNAQEIDSLMKRFGSLSLGQNFSEHCKTTQFDANHQGRGKTANFLKHNETEGISVKSCSFILLAEGGTSFHLTPQKLVDMSTSVLGSVADGRGIIGPDKFREFEPNFEVCRLSNDAWLLKPPDKIAFKAVFTGLYT